MKSITKLLVSIYTLICYTSFAQSPSFSTNLNISNSFVCFDGQLTVSAMASNADFYQFQRRNETTNLWENIIGASGTPNPTTGSLNHTFFNIREATTTRVYLSKNAEIVYSNDLTITPQRPTFDFQPIDITECNGLNAVFRASAVGINTITYQWQENIGGVFLNATNATDFSGMTSANLTVKNLANNENGRIFRCLVKDQNNCENYSSAVTLFVNQLSTVINPLVSTTFCEGDTAQFFVALKVGAVSSYEWQLKKTLDAGYSNIIESNHFKGVNTEKLSVNGIFPNETSYRLNVNFVSLGQNTDGARASSTCLKTATRANYIIRPRPNPPTQIPDIYRCGEGKFTTTAAGTGSFFWYSDTTTAPMISNNANFASPLISESKQYYLSLKDINQCESYKRTFNAIIRPLPKQEYTKTYSICPSEIFFTLNFNSKNHNPLHLNVINHAPALPNFTPVLNGTFSDSFNVPLPNNPPSGNYKFKVFSKNQHCYSDTSIIDLEIKQATLINVSPSNSTICEGLNNTFNIQYSAETPVYFRWFKDDIIIPNETTSTLNLENITPQTQGNYTVEVSGQCGTKISEKALLTVLPKVKITEQPKETLVCQNGNAKIKLAATGTGILNYKWTLNGVGIGTNSTELTLENVPISYNNAKIKCEISSDCGQSVFSNEILLLVDDLPPAPTVPSSIGFCKSNTPGILNAIAMPKHKLTWYNESQNPLVSNQLDVSTIFTKTYYVSQKDTNLCEGPKSSFQVVVSEPFSINLLADKARICSSGLFNRSGFINTVVYSTNSDLSSFSFDLLKNNLLKSNNNTGDFEINEGGLYKVVGKSNFCSDTSEIEITSILPELAVPPSILHTFEVCKNSNLTIEVSGSYSNGKFHWYSNATTQFSDFSGSSRTLNNIISDQSHYVAYGITSNDIYCESPRVLSSISLKPDLVIDAVVQNTSCLGINNGKIESSINNGQSPYTFTLNNINNSTGVFENLSIGNYLIKASDSKGCKGEKTISIGVLPGPIIAQQPVSISRCKSNIANFTIVANNYDQIIWEKKLPNNTSFEIIIGENQANLRVENIGNVTNPHLTIYRAKVIKGACFIYSEVATLFVNAITGTGSPKSVCEGNKSTIDLNDYNIEGSNKTYQWQYRPGTTGTFVDVNGKTSEILEILSTSISNIGYYRCKITFDNGGGNTCIINTSTSGIKLNIDTPQIPLLSGEKTICKGQTTALSGTNCTGILTWSDGSTGFNVNISPNSTTTFTANCKNGACDSPSGNSVKIIVEDNPVNAPKIILARTKYCVGEKINLTAENCIGTVVWSNGLQGNSFEIDAVSSFNISAHCKTQNCQSPESPPIAVTVYPVLTAGSIVSNSTINCSGFNPLTINSITNPNGGNIQWQKSENCSSQNPIWVNINGETGLTYNPPALLISTCFRRMASDSCQSLFSNTTTFEIVPDPILEILSDKNQVCFGQKVIFSKNLVGGDGVCGIQWQINKVSSAVSSTFWTNIAVADVLEFKNSNAGNDSTFHFRARVDCSNSSCNLATSNVVSVVFHPELVINTAFSDSTICSGSTIILASSGCKANVLWSTGETTAQISVSPIVNTAYKVSCKNSCDEVSKSFNIGVVEGIGKPSITIAKTKYCFGENIQISASNCAGIIVWSNGLSGNLINISASNSFNISAHCKTQYCQSPESLPIAVIVYPVLTAGSIVSNSTINCSGFNPLTINSIINPSGGNIQWQKSENCSSQNPTWVNINGETGLTYNPPALLISTCFRRMVSDSCQTLFSNTTTFEIVPDPILEIMADKNQVCFGQKVIFSKNLIGGEGVCGIQWQINKVSSAVSSAFWTNITDADAFEFKNTNTGNDSTFHFRARVDCSNSSCNLAISNVVSVVFHPELLINTAFSDSTICSGSTIILASSGCKANILWSTGETTAQISVSPIVNTVYKVSCKNSCDEVSKSFNIGVVEGIGKPINTTPKSFLSPQILKFTAEGQNLKWYNSINSMIPLSLAPEITVTGNYTFWVTQTIGICESPRLEIQSELFPALQIISQPSNITNCFGNTSNIEITASGSGTLKYKWQRKRPNETSFSDITLNQSSLENFDSKELKIKSLGNPESPYLTIFRCIINDDFSEKQSEEIEIVVNRLEGNLANQKLCLGNNLDLNLNNSHKITGSPKIIQWQQREGTGTDWINLKDSANYSGTNTLHFYINNLTLENQKQYRCSVVFNSTTGTCTETTDLMSLNVGFFPQTPENKGFEFCQNVSSPELELYEPNNVDIIWYLPGSQIGMNKQPIIDTKNPGNQIYFYSLKNTADCESPKSTVQIIINPEPPKPINTTPSQVTEGQPLIFNAVGENLKWYTSRTGKTFTSTSPSYQKIGSYDHYVSQTSPKGCESDRTYIESEIITAFGITTQPINQTNCEDNTTTFSIKTKGSTSVSYRWQMLKNNVFEDILGENTSSLKIEDVGKAPYLDGTIYRCVVSNSTQEIFSNEVTLKVNKIEGKLADIEICENTLISTSMLKENIVGNFSQIEWQKKEGESYSTKFISKKIEDNFWATTDNSGTYRLRFTFQNQGSSTCVRTSNSLKIDVNKKPEPLQKLNYSVCQYASIKTILKEFPTNYIFKNLDSSIINITYFNEPKQMVFIGNYTNDKGCTSNYQKINFEILPAPILQIVDSTINYCQFTNELKSLKINDLNTYWYASETDEEATENAFQINTSENQTHFRWYALESNNGCLSQKNKIKIDLNPCFYSEKKDTCITQSAKVLMPNEWNYFYNANGKIYAAIHPEGQNLGTARIDFRNTKNSLLMDINETHLYPRYFNVQTSRKSTSKFKLRFYMTLEEITAITRKEPKDVSVINYAGKNLDCDLLNNKIEDNYWLETNETWQEDSQKNIFFAEFSTQKTGEFGLWDASIPNGLLIGEVNSTNIPVLSLSDKSSGGNYKIMKSKDGKTWFEWLENITQQEFFDFKPFVLDNYYQLIFDFGNGIKTLRNTIKLSLADEDVTCTILENPSENRDFFKLYFPNIDKTTIQLSTALGQTLDLTKTTEVSDHMEIYPKSQLPPGMYILKAQNSSGKNCFAKVWLK